MVFIVSGGLTFISIIFQTSIISQIAEYVCFFEIKMAVIQVELRHYQH